MRMLGLHSPQVLHDFHGKLLPNLLCKLADCSDATPLMVAVILECISLAEPGGDGIDLTVDEADRRSPVWSWVGPWFHCCIKESNNQSQRSPVRSELIAGLRRVARYRFGGIQAALKTSLLTSGLHQPELIAIVSRLLIVPLAHEEFLPEPSAEPLS
jgi:hypothetical protein